MESTIFRFFGKLPKTQIFILGLSVNLLIGLIDFLTGRDISLSIFYLLPIGLVTWYISTRAALVMSLMSTFTWVIADYQVFYNYDHPFTLVWNVIVRFTFYRVVYFLIAELKKALEYEKALARTDGLTGLTNRRFFMDLAATEIHRARRFSRQFTLAYIDIDNFKRANDSLGHATGDAILKAAADIMRRNTRDTDIACRLGGDEFAILFPETDYDAAASVLAKVHTLLCGAMKEEGWPVTFSIGAVTFKSSPASIDEMVNQADEVMYSVKKGSKNAVRHKIFHGPVEAAPGEAASKNI